MGRQLSGYVEYMVYEALLTAANGENVEIHCASEFQANKIFELMKEVASQHETELVTVIVDSKCKGIPIIETEVSMVIEDEID